MKVIYNSNGSNYQGDLLMRVYWRNGFRADVQKRIGTNAHSKFDGQISAEHPQGLQNTIQRILREQESTNTIVEISNEFKDHEPHPDNRYWTWFNTAIKNAINGDRRHIRDDEPDEQFMVNDDELSYITLRIYECSDCPHLSSAGWSRRCIHPLTKAFSRDYTAPEMPKHGISKDCPLLHSSKKTSKG